MSIHPNAILVLALTPDDLPFKTYRAILEDVGCDNEDDINIGDQNYHHGVMEGTYADSYQICLPEGTIYLVALVTYGYGEKIAWEKLAVEKAALEEWAKGICERHHCKAEIFVSANYW